MDSQDATSSLRQFALKEELRRYVQQQDALFGDVVVGERAQDATPTSPRADEAQPARIEPPPHHNADLTERLIVINEPWVESPSLDSFNQMICGCQKCDLGKTRKNFVFGVGNPQADIVVIGEAPGAEEDARGEPFVGAAGQLLNKILSAINLKREDVYICNILKCRPPGNRTPERFEVEQCEPYLLRQLDLIQPKFILALGLTAANTLLNRKARMGELRGTVHDYHGISVVVTYHPAALLRNQQWKRPTWEDVQMLRRLYDERLASDPR